MTVSLGRSLRAYSNQILCRLPESLKVLMTQLPLEGHLISAGLAITLTTIESGGIERIGVSDKHKT